jgi:ATP-dependent Clp protease ATP-binding subunit ClpC
MGTPDLETHAHLMVRELWSGDYLAFPIADDKLASYGTSEDVIQEARLFLQEYLASAPADVVARFSTPEATRLAVVEVLVPKDGLPRRLEVKTPIAFSAIVIPIGSDTWVIVPRLGHTFYLQKGDDLEEAIRAEVKRIASARELTASDYIDLFPAREEMLEIVDVAFERDDRAPGGRAAALKKKLIDRLKRRNAFEVLASIAIPLHEKKEATEGPALVGRDAELDALDALLSGKDRLSAVLLGPELVGKSALVFAWLRRKHALGERPLAYSTSGAQLIAGMSGLGQWQERVRRVMDAAEALDAVIYFENLADLFGDRSSGHVDIPNAMKPYIQDGRIRLIGELTPEALDLFESAHAGFFGGLNRIRIDPLSAKTTAQALEERIAFERAHDPDRPSLAADAIATLIDLVDRYLPYRPFPGKALRFYEELRTIQEKAARTEGQARPIDKDAVLEAFSLETGIPVFLLRDDRALRAERVAAEFKKHLIGQTRAIERVVETICVVKAGLQPQGKPLATFLFVGPTGVGKTELARTLATFLFGSADRLVRFDMSEYVDGFAAERLIRGTHRSEGLLTKRIRQQPFCVLLLDEIEKANPAVFDLLLQVSGEGRLTDVKGRTAHFHNTIIIMTSNLGAAHRKEAIGIGVSSSTSEEHYLKEVNRSFRPEFVNRLDRIISFDELLPDEVKEVSRLALTRIESRRGLLEAGVTLRVDESALARLAKGGYSETYGARALRRHLDDHLIAPVSRLLGRVGPDARGGTLRVLDRKTAEVDLDRSVIGTLDHHDLCFRLLGGRTAASRKDEWSAESTFEMRRNVERYLLLERVKQVKEQIGFLLSQLSYGGGSAKKDERSAREMAVLQTEHYRLSQLWEKSSALHQDVLAAEELALVALFEGEPTREYFEEAKKAYSAFRKSLVYLLLAQESQRDQATLIIQELDEGRGFDLWLLPLIRFAVDRGWEIAVHLDRDREPPSADWPAARRFGPPRPPARARELLATDVRGDSALIRVRGPYAGVLLALEAGLHRFIKVHPTVNPVHFMVQLISMRFEVTDKEWLSEQLQPPIPNPQVDLTKLKATREHDGTNHRLILPTKRILPIVPDRYWDSFEEIALEHLLVFEEGEELDRDRIFASKLGGAQMGPA